MIDNMLVIDAVVHPYDLSEENQVPAYRAQLDAVYAAHRMSFDDAHRAHMLTYEEFFSDISYGHCRYGKFKCPWHGFGYDLEGKCTTVPLRESFDEKELAGLRTPPVRAFEWNGLVWITLSDATPPLKDFLGVLWDELGWYRMDRFEIRYRVAPELNQNWKGVVDAFNETWHVPFTHQETLSRMMLWRDARIRVCPPHSWMTLPVAKFTEKFGPETDHHEANVCHYRKRRLEAAFRSSAVSAIFVG